MLDWLHTHYTLVASSLYFFALVWAAFLGVEHRLEHPRGVARFSNRSRRVFVGSVVAWACIALSLTVGLDDELRSMGLSFSLFAAFQILVVWTAWPAGVRWEARSRVLRRRPPSAADASEASVSRESDALACRRRGRRKEGETESGTALGVRGKREWASPGRGKWLGPVCAGVAAIFISHLALALSVRAGYPPKPTPEAALFFQPKAWREIGLVLSILLAAPIEEIVFRLVLQGRLEVWARRLGWTALVPVAIVSFLWTMGHAGMIEPRGLKEFQIFVLGLLFGWTRLRWGLAGSIVAHGILNGFACLAMTLTKFAG